MNPYRTRIILAAWLAMAMLLSVTPAPGHGGERPRVGLALSGGAARGFVHIGVLKVLEEAGLPVDCIAGTSMGAVVGGLYAAGYSPAEIESLSVAIDWDDLFSDTVGRRKLAMAYKRWDARYTMSFPIEGWRVGLPSGLIAGQKITRLLSRLTLPVHHVEQFSDLPTPFVCLATDIETGEAVGLKHGDLAEAIRASMAIPTVFTPVEIDGRLLVDGGVARNLPAEDARDLGADIVIGVDAVEPLYKKGELNSMMRIMDQTVHFQIAGTTREQKRLCDILIVPEADKQGFEFDQAAYFVEQGELAARLILPRLTALADSIHLLPAPAPRPRPQRSDSVYVTEVFIEGLQRVPKRVVESEIGITPPLWMTADELDETIDEVYKYDYFERVGYTVEKSGERSQLGIRVVENAANVFRAGLRYDSKTNLALLLNTTFRNSGVAGGVLALDLRIGDDTLADLRYLFPAGRSLRGFGLQTVASYSRTSIDVFEGDQRTAQYRTEYTYGELIAGTIYSSRLSLYAGARAEYIESEVRIGAEDLPDRNDTVIPFFAGIRIDTVDRTLFPRGGLFVDLVAEATTTSAGSEQSFARYYGDWRLYIPVARKWSLRQSMYAGTVADGDIPPAYQFSLGGIHNPHTYLGEESSFFGLKRSERTGRHIQSFGLGVQWECYRRVFVLVRGNVGNTFEQWNTDYDWDNFTNGIGLTLGLNIPALPVEITVMTGSEHEFLSHLTVGYTF
jgi:NTE family protein